MKLNNKIAIVTGGASGIGKAISSLFAKEGAKVVIADLDSKSGEKIAKQIENVNFVETDISKEKDVEDLIRSTIGEYGKVDVLVNNAGIGSNKGFEELTKRDWQRILETNLIGTFLCTQKASKFMEAGSIINISSTSGLEYCASESRPSYSASKAGIINLTKSTARKLGPEIRVNCIAPGYIDAGLNAEMPEAKKRQVSKETPLGRLGKADEVAKVALFLASEDSSFITGEVIVVDGGESI